MGKTRDKMDYVEFLEQKRHSSNNFGIDTNFLPDSMFDFQKYITEYSIKKGRCANFLDTGTGKTLIELTIANNYIHFTNKPVLIITPLAVAFQFLKEAEKFGFGDIEYSKMGKYKSKIVICNYERLQYFDSKDFDCVILDESSILKNFDGSIKNDIDIFLKKVKYRYLFTATPSPNDFIELGTSSEALGYLGYTDMLTKFFTNNEDTISPMNIGTEWLLKGHAKKAFFEWVSSWSISMRKPSDLGFNDDKFILPELKINHHTVDNDNLFIMKNGVPCFNLSGVSNNSMSEIKVETRQTIKERCELAVTVAKPHETTVYWTNLNPEADLIEKLDKDTHQISGSMSIEQKEEILLAFVNKDIKKLITKPKITAFGLNWQHCNHTIYFPSFSYERYYQALRRFWRFGQTRPVIADLVYSTGEKKMVDSLIVKERKANELFSQLNANLNRDYKIKTKEFNKQIILPKW